MGVVDDIGEKYRLFAERECKDYSPAYYHLALEIADDPEVLSFVAQQPVTQPNLLFASVQYLTGPEHMPLSSAALRGFLQRHGDAVAALMRDRRTQTNEVGRCATVLPAMPTGRIALVEVGASAGLCLLLDKYHYDYGFAQVGDPDAHVHLQCKAQGPVPVPVTMPDIVWSRGVDLNPLDVRCEDDARWLLACVWADHPERRQHLEAALSVARQHSPWVIAGDVSTELPALLTEAPREAQLVVFHSATLPYLSEEHRDDLTRILTAESRRRNIVWISNKACGLISEFAEMAPKGTRRAFLLGKTILSEGRRVDALLALAHPHGAELEWLS
jgi:hypothetical protein